MCSQCLLMHATTTVFASPHDRDGDNYSNVFNNRINKLDDVTPVTLINWPNTCQGSVRNQTFNMHHLPFWMNAAHNLEEYYHADVQELLTGMPLFQL